MKEEREGANEQMDVRDFLERARYINMEIDSKLEHVTALRYLACKVNNTFSETPLCGHRKDTGRGQPGPDVEP